MSRKNLGIKKNFLNYEPYRSIINILRTAPRFHPIYSKGMKPKELMDLVIKDYTIGRRKKDKQRLDILSEFRKFIDEGLTDRIMLDQDIKPGVYKDKKRKKEEEQKQDAKSGGGRRKTPSAFDFHNLFNNYLKRLGDFGWIGRKNGFCSIGKGRNFAILRDGGKDILKSRGNNIITDTDLDCAILHPSPAHSYMYCTPNMKTDDIKSSVKNLRSRVELLEKNLKAAQVEWMGILFDARDASLMELWNGFLRNGEIYTPAKLDFCLDRILEIRKVFLYSVSPPERNIEEQWDSLMDIKRKAFNSYLRKRYPTLKLHVGKLHKKINDEYKLKTKYFDETHNKIIRNRSNTKLESIIVVDFLGIGTHKSNELKTAGLVPSVTLDRDKPLGEMHDKLKKLSDIRYPYDELPDNDWSEKYKAKTVKKKLYVKPPFFKNFFHEFEDDLVDLGFEKKKGNNSLENFYDALDETAEILRVPALPDDLDALLQK